MKFALCPVTDEDFRFAFEVKSDAMGPHVRARWGWDEAYQLQHHQRRWRGKRWQIIVVEGKPVGTVSVDVKLTHIQLGKFYVASGFRGKRAGHRSPAVGARDRRPQRLEARLEYLQWKPTIGNWTSTLFVSPHESSPSTTRCRRRRRRIGTGTGQLRQVRGARLGA
jgi:hypothetical protein